MSIKMVYNRCCISGLAWKRSHGKMRILVAPEEFCDAFEALLSDWRILPKIDDESTVGNQGGIPGYDSP